MTDAKFDRMRLVLMQEILPMGFAVLDRARNGGFSRVWQVLKDSNDPLDHLKKEGDDAAQNFREKLDSVSPGLGNPVMSVSVDIQDPSDSSVEIQDQDELVQVLVRIESRLNEVEKYLAQNVTSSSSD